MSGILITNNVIADAYLWVLDKSRSDKSREFRMLLHKDFRAIHNLLGEIERQWQPHRQTPRSQRPKYYEWRSALLDKQAKEKCWSQQTRNLYASICAVLKSWQLYGQNAQTQKRIAELRIGARLFLQFIEGYQPDLD